MQHVESTWFQHLGNGWHNEWIKKWSYSIDFFLHNDAWYFCFCSKLSDCLSSSDILTVCNEVSYTHTIKKMKICYCLIKSNPYMRPCRGYILLNSFIAWRSMFALLVFQMILICIIYSQHYALLWLIKYDKMGILNTDNFQTSPVYFTGLLNKEQVFKQIKQRIKFCETTWTRNDLWIIGVNASLWKKKGRKLLQLYFVIIGPGAN